MSYDSKIPNKWWVGTVVSLKAGDSCDPRYWNIALADTEQRPKKWSPQMFLGFQEHETRINEPILLS